MQYIDEASGSVLLPKILGTYESALIPWIVEAQNNGYETLIDVGCAEGYYAVGFAKTCSGIQVFAYDLNPMARELCQILADTNSVLDRIEIRPKQVWHQFRAISES